MTEQTIKFFDPLATWRALAPDIQERIGALAIAAEISLCNTQHVEIANAEYWLTQNIHDTAAGTLEDLIGDLVSRDLVEPEGYPIPPDLNTCGIRQCTSCGCTKSHACNGGCSWAGPTLCTACVPMESSHGG